MGEVTTVAAISAGPLAALSVDLTIGQQLDVALANPEGGISDACCDLSAEDRALTEPGSDTTAWSGDFPLDGVVLISVGSKRGGCTYDLTVSITGEAT